MKTFLLALAFSGLSYAQCASGLYTLTAAANGTVSLKCVTLGAGLLLDGSTLGVNGSVVRQSVVPKAGQMLQWNAATGWTPVTLPASAPSPCAIAISYTATPAQAADGSYTFEVLASGGQSPSTYAAAWIQVFRNGLRQTYAVDYQLSLTPTSATSATARIAPMTPWAADDVISAFWVL